MPSTTGRSTAESHDAVIRVYGEVGNVIDDRNTQKCLDVFDTIQIKGVSSPDLTRESLFPIE